MPKPNAQTPAVETADAAPAQASREAIFNATMHQRLVQDLGDARMAVIEAGVRFDMVQEELARKTAECQATAEQLAAAREEIQAREDL